VKFWDTSAIVPLLVDEPASSRVEEVVRGDPDMLVWWGTPIECLSALARRERDGGLSPKGADQARELLKTLSGSWSEVVAGMTVRDHAGRLLRRHSLRAADALQLAAALTWARGAVAGHELCTFDDRLAAAARAEGFALVFAS
jgi:hypothetical protein